MVKKKNPISLIQQEHVLVSPSLSSHSPETQTHIQNQSNDWWLTDEKWFVDLLRTKEVRGGSSELTDPRRLRTMTTAGVMMVELGTEGGRLETNIKICPSSASNEQRWRYGGSERRHCDCEEALRETHHSFLFTVARGQGGGVGRREEGWKLLRSSSSLSSSWSVQQRSKRWHHFLPGVVCRVFFLMISDTAAVLHTNKQSQSLRSTTGHRYTSALIHLYI